MIESMKWKIILIANLLAMLLSCRENSNQSKETQTSNMTISDTHFLDTGIVDTHIENDENESYLMCISSVKGVKKRIAKSYEKDLIEKGISNSEILQLLPFVKERVFLDKKATYWYLEPERALNKLSPRLIEIAMTDSFEFSIENLFKERADMQLKEEVFFKTGFMVLQCTNALLFVLVSDCAYRKLLSELVDQLMARGMKPEIDFYRIYCGGTIQTF